VLDTALLKELHGAGDVEVPTVHDPALAGTALAAWVSNATTVPDAGGGTLPSAAPPTGRPAAPAAPDHEIR
jgi:hypothetical protein